MQTSVQLKEKELELLKSGDIIIVDDPKTGDKVSMVMDYLCGFTNNENKDIFLTTEDSDRESFNRGHGRLEYTDYIKHVRIKDGTKAVMTVSEMAEILVSKEYWIG